MTKRIKGISVHLEDGTSTTHLFAKPPRMTRASFFPHEGDFKETVPTEPAPLMQESRELPEADNPWTVRLLVVVILLAGGIAAYFSRS